MIELTAFLGNPGGEYRGNRHNAGWLAAGALPFSASLNWQKKYKGRYASMDAAPAGRLHFIMPDTYMNCSGESVYAAAAFFKIPPERILVVHDELELPLGTVGLKFSGGLGGHNGLRSMKQSFGTADFWRLRIGIGRPEHSDVAGYVLSDFSAAEKPLLDQVLAAASELLALALSGEPESLLPEWGKKKIT
jgi:PTH1 family peptidyl-tRNA hydrolase